MKKTLMSLLILLVPFAAGAETLKVVTTTTDLASITREIGGDLVEVSSIAKGYQDPHYVEAKPSFLFELREADLLEVVGLELEMAWLPPLLNQSRNPKIRPGNPAYLDLSRRVEIVDRPTGPIDRSMGDIHAQGNPHYWLEPGNAIRVAWQIREKLIELDPANENVYEARYLEFKRRMNVEHQKWGTKLQRFAESPVVTYHRSWSNFVERYDLNVVDFVEPKPGVPPSPSHIFQLVKRMKELGVKVILVEPYFDLKVPNSIAEKTGAKVVVLYPSVIEGDPKLDDVFKVFDHNVNAVVDALR